jgi:hypothetical protein
VLCGSRTSAGDTNEHGAPETPWISCCRAWPKRESTKCVDVARQHASKAEHAVTGQLLHKAISTFRNPRPARLSQLQHIELLPSSMHGRPSIPHLSLQRFCFNPELVLLWRAWRSVGPPPRTIG